MQIHYLTPILTFQGLEDLLNYDEDDEDEVERSWRR